jgi:hypothetical protein
MAINAHLPGFRWFHVFRNAAVRTGVYAGVFLSLTFTIWLVLANRVPVLERLALERNMAAAAALLLFAAVPIFRFLRWPGYLLASGLIAWLIFSVTYRILCLLFSGLNDKLSAFHLFVLGTIVYLIVTTICWLGGVIWRARESHATHPNNHAS